MPPRTVKSVPVRPDTVTDEPVPTCCLECCRQQKIDTALNVVSLFLEATKPNLVATPTDEPNQMSNFARELNPKENSTYMAALDWLERYLDTEDITAPTPRACA